MFMKDITEYEEEMRWVMRYVLDNGNLNSLDGEERRLLKDCVDAGYIDGIEMAEVASGDVVGQIKYSPILTRAGIKFLSEHNEMKKGEGASAGERSEQAKQKKLWIAENYWIPLLILIVGGLVLEFLFALFGDTILHLNNLLNIMNGIMNLSLHLINYQTRGNLS